MQMVTFSVADLSTDMPGCIEDRPGFQNRDTGQLCWQGTVCSGSIETFNDRFPDDECSGRSHCGGVSVPLAVSVVQALQRALQLPAKAPAVAAASALPAAAVTACRRLPSSTDPV